MRGIALGALACFAALSACTSTDGAPAPPSGTRLSPEIPVELDVARFASEPCKLLSAKQPVANDVVAGVADGSTCTWRGKKVQFPTYTVSVDTKAGGLEGLYRRRGQLPRFEPTVTSGFPAVFVDAERKEPDRGRCTLTMGVADDSVITVSSAVDDPKSPDYAVPCTDTEFFARSVIANIKSGNA